MLCPSNDREPLTAFHPSARVPLVAAAAAADRTPAPFQAPLLYPLVSKVRMSDAPKACSARSLAPRSIALPEPETSKLSATSTLRSAYADALSSDSTPPEEMPTPATP